MTPFNYAQGKQYGAELTGNYTSEAFSAYLNLAYQSAKGKDIDSAQFNFSQEDLNYIASHYIHLDHEQQVTASGGVSYLWLHTRFSADFLLGSGLRADEVLPDGSSIPNGARLPYYTQVNLGVNHIFHFTDTSTLTARFDVLNVLDKKYEIRDGTGVGVGAPQYGPRRGLFFGIGQIDLDGIERGVQIGDQIIRIFDAHGDADQGVGDSQPVARGFRDTGMSGAGRMRDQRFGAAQADCELDYF